MGLEHGAPTSLPYPALQFLQSCRILSRLSSDAAFRAKSIVMADGSKRILGPLYLFLAGAIWGGM